MLQKIAPKHISWIF